MSNHRQHAGLVKFESREGAFQPRVHMTGFRNVVSSGVQRGKAGLLQPLSCGTRSVICGSFMFCAALSQSAHAQQGSYTRVELPQHLSIEVPSHWKVLPRASRANVAAAGRAMMESAEQDASTGKKETLLAVNATPEPSGAMVRVSVTRPPEYSQEDLKAATTSDLKELEVELSQVYRKLEAAGGPTVIQMHPVRLETVAGRRALSISYRRTSAAGPSPWQVVQYKVPLSDRLVEVTLSYRESDAALWRPILEKVKRSLRL